MTYYASSPASYFARDNADNTFVATVASKVLSGAIDPPEIIPVGNTPNITGSTIILEPIASVSSAVGNELVSGIHTGAVTAYQQQTATSTATSTFVYFGNATMSGAFRMAGERTQGTSTDDTSFIIQQKQNTGTPGVTVWKDTIAISNNDRVDPF